MHRLGVPSAHWHHSTEASTASSPASVVSFGTELEVPRGPKWQGRVDAKIKQITSSSLVVLVLVLVLVESSNTLG